MNKNQAIGHSIAKHETDEDFEWMGDSPKENSVFAEVNTFRSLIFSDKIQLL